MPLDQWVGMRSALQPLITNTERALLSFEVSCVGILETVKSRTEKFVRETAGIV